jgi:hypothetical protein
MAKNGTTSWRVEQLEKRLKIVDTRVYKIMTNHLPHLTEEVSSLKTRIYVATAINVGAIIFLGYLMRNF